MNGQKPEGRGQMPDARSQRLKAGGRKAQRYTAPGMAVARRLAATVQVVVGTDLPSIKIGEFTLTKLADGVFWLLPVSGEGMSTTEAEIEAVLRDFWRKEF